MVVIQVTFVWVVTPWMFIAVRNSSHIMVHMVMCHV